MKLQTLYSLIDLPAEITRNLDTIDKENIPALYEKDLHRLTSPKTAAIAYQDITQLLGKDPGHLKMLYCQLKCAGRIADKYESLGISRQIYIDTMKCFSRFIRECQEKNGEMFFDRGWWTYRQISMTLFRLGSLEYELCEEAGEPVIGIHIPSDADLSSPAVDHSLKEAARFFETYYHGLPPRKYTCDSWLLSPSLKPFLPQDSNIASFQQRFVILKENPSDDEFIEWLFRRPKNTNYERLPEDTSLQRSVKALLLEGGTIGAASGVLRQP
ncbi:MAG: acyltransferase domain-containing protein [Roseburia sp.]|nr:acyltransferase domain-containing protein [Roseburia sp.]MCM1097880.1 acyltransferase domain-containing protein [Ruminococcus flavefaciens]